MGMCAKPVLGQKLKMLQQFQFANMQQQACKNCGYTCGVLFHAGSCETL